MKVVILAGGFGTRLSEETDFIPKPMIEIGGHPLLWHIMKMFSSHGFNEFVVALGYKSEVIKQFFIQYPYLSSDMTIDLAAGKITSAHSNLENWKIELVDTGMETMTGGRLKRLREHLDSTFFFTYGDGLTNVNLRELLDFHCSHEKLATVTAARPPSRFGVLALDGDHVRKFNEKSQDNSAYINGGFFVLEPETLDYIEDDSTSWERQPCERLAEAGELVAYRHHGFWQCVDTLHELRLLRDIWNKKQAPWKIWD